MPRRSSAVSVDGARERPAQRDPSTAEPAPPPRALGGARTAEVVATPAPPTLQDIRDATLVKEGDVFLLADLEGNVPAGNEDGFGLYLRDTRFLSTYDLEVQGLRPTILLSSGRWHFLGAYVLTNPNLVTDEGERVAAQTVQIRRYRVARGRRVSESLTFQNFNVFALAIELTMHLDADFADMFEVRGRVTSGVGPRRVVHEIEGAALTFYHDGSDGTRRTTRVSFDPAPASLSDGAARYRLELSARGSHRVTIEIEMTEAAGGGEEPQLARHARGTPSTTAPGWLDGGARLTTSNDRFNHIVAQARADLAALVSGDAERTFVAAGIPWYAALFGRDSLITALESVWIAPALAKHTLVLLARGAARRDGPSRAQEPGKILHESRRGELARAGLVPYDPYFGTIDATPLWIVVLDEYFRATGDLALVRQLRPNLDAALDWIDVYGDLDDDGFVEYRARSPTGLLHQGWKDSWDAIVHSDGSLAEPPIALVEVQAYVYAAKRAAATLFRALGDPGLAARMDAEAERLRDAFEATFWMPSEGFYCMALDREKRQVAAIASNPGQALWSGIVAPERAARVAERLMSEDLFSGWGVRTLSNREVRYNPVGYHLGTVWPHDNALIALGLKRYGLDAPVLEIASGLFDAALHFPSCRMPELFCGFARGAFGVPVRYPVACSPQAWAAGSWSMLLQTMLGVRRTTDARELSIARPALPSWLEWVEVERLPMAAGQVDLRYERVAGRTAVDVVAMRGDVRVALSDRWPE